VPNVPDPESVPVVTEVRNDGRAQMDRQFGELLQELRVGQTGVQLLFGFLLAIPFQTRYGSLSPGMHLVFSATVVLATLSLACLMTPVLLHRWSFRRHVRPTIINVSHYAALVGLYLLLLAVVGAVSVVASIAVPGTSVGPWLVGLCAAGLVGLWVVGPLLLRETAQPERPQCDSTGTGS
jgi:hypothetical protein